jgi:hypothetical protein
LCDGIDKQFDEATKVCSCTGTSPLNEKTNICTPCGDGEVYDDVRGKCSCKSGYYRVAMQLQP